MMSIMTHDALHYTALHNTQPRTILNLTGTTLQSWHLVGTILAPRGHNTKPRCAQHCTILNLVGNL